MERNNSGGVISTLRKVLVSASVKIHVASAVDCAQANVKQGDMVPKGFPSMAAMQTQWSSTRTFRTFEYLHLRQLRFYETKLSYLQDELHRLDVLEDGMMRGSQRTKLPFNRKMFIDCCFREPDPSYMSEAPETEENALEDKINDLREKLYAHMENISKKHRMSYDIVMGLERRGS